jgi:hypothetical protein
MVSEYLNLYASVLHGESVGELQAA